MKEMVHIEFTGLAAALARDASDLAEPDLAGFVPSVGDILELRDWPGNEVRRWVCRGRRLDLTQGGERHVHIQLDMAPPASAPR